ncbi:unnamed protein product [Mytilus coruscus]|uniref:Reverse transcriptase domain-containing protein n=1 Tax=Mytilus coruscus TaxID=42192 RepID=A0A6J8APW6_MYTCO|nr:unnamed protein product [Mytilus coruscus]
MRDDEAGVEQSPIHNISCTNQSPFLGYAHCAKKTSATYEFLSTKETNVPPSSDKTEESESCPPTKCPSTISSDPQISEPKPMNGPPNPTIDSAKNLTTHSLNILTFNIEGLTSNLVNNYSRDDYLAVLDELIEIVTKYRDSANILIGGDMNASIFRNHPRDNDFKNFIHNNNLRIPDNCVECSTFYHFNNRDESQIDYFIQNFDFINTYCTYSRESANTSTHDPIMKKGKPKEDPGSYRKITITNPIGKLTEKLHLVRNKDNICNIQSILQKGFTQGEIPLVAALILTELHTEAKENGDPLVIALTDAKSAFDVVSHDGLLRQMNKADLCGVIWLLFKDWYKGLNSNIKWQGQTSRTFLESQGVRQGGVWSPTAYKIFINSLLTTLETYRIGSIYVGVPTVADYIENFESWKACIKFDFAIIIFHISFEVSCTGYLSLSHLLCGPVCFYVNIFRSCLYPLIHYV